MRPRKTTQTLSSDKGHEHDVTTLGNFKVNSMDSELEADIARAQEPATLGSFKINEMSNDLKADIPKAGKTAPTESNLTTEGLDTPARINYRASRKPISQNFFKRHPWVRWALYGLAIGAIAGLIGVSLAFSCGGAAPVIALGAAIVGANLGATAAALVGASVIIASAGALLGSFLGIFKKAGSSKKNKAIKTSKTTNARTVSRFRSLYRTIAPTPNKNAVNKRSAPTCFRLFARKRVRKQANNTQQAERTSFKR